MTAETVSITLNGAPADVPAGASISELLRQRGRDPEAGGLAVAVNGDIVRRALWDEARLAAGDRVEVITAFQGG